MTATADLSSRYGRRSSHASPQPSGRRRMSRPAIIATVVGLAAASGVAAWYGLAPGPTPDGTKDVSYEVVDSTLTRATIAVQPDDARDIVCAVRAVSVHDAVVGYTEIDVPADPAADSSTPHVVTTDITTTQLAASGHHESCWYADDPQI
ncbi:DUF4307 domain-containing protein [Brevibacterium jeotgali]|uniref:DUF4307 domain-containing protein n=1 Tax=Brevibacterium jeotgali TaxID=1262550 RepID=UPI0015E09BFA|nr:DUF4307 domain-containing protein [Brevibacterium jeotgali]